MKSLQFPDMFGLANSLNIVSDYYATKQNLIELLACDKGSLFGDPYYGTNLKKYLYDQNDAILQDLLIDDIYTAIQLFMPQIKTERKNITITSEETGKLTATISAMNKASFTTDLYSIVLLQADV